MAHDGDRFCKTTIYFFINKQIIFIKRMKTNLLKTLLLATGLLVGGSNVWAAPSSYLSTWTGTVGLTDYTSDFNYGSKKITIADGESYVFTFVNYNNDNSSNADATWIFECTDGTNFVDVRANGGNWVWTGEASKVFTDVSYTGSTSSAFATTEIWNKAYNGVTVTLTVSRTGNVISATHTATTNAVDEVASTTYTASYSTTYSGSNDVSFYITNVASYQHITKVVYTDASSNETTYTSVYSNDFSTSGWTANGKSDGWRVNPGTTSVNSFASSVIGNGAGTGDMGLVSPTMSIGNDISVVDVSMKFKMDACTGGKSSGIEFITSDVTVSNGYVSAGTPFFAIKGSATNNTYWSSITVGGTDYTSTINTSGNFENNSNNGRNTTGIVTLYVRFNFSSKTATFTLWRAGEVLVSETTVAFANLDATTLDRIFIHAGKTYGGVTIDDVEVCTVKSDVQETTYRATFSEANSLNPTVTIYSDSERTEEATNGLLEDGQTYYYTAVLEGYQNYEGSFTVDGEDPTVNYTMSLKTRYTFTINAIDANENVIKALYSDEDSYEGKSHTVSFSKFLTDNNNVVTYTKNDVTYHSSYTAKAQNETYTVSYTAYSGTAYFYEGESFNSLGTHNESSNYSGNTAGSGSTSTIDILTVPSSGVYRLSYAVCSGNVNNTYTYSFYRNSSEDVIVGPADCTWSVNNVKSAGTKSVENVVMAENDVLQFVASNGNIILDYVLLEKVSSESVTVSAYGYATYVSDYNLDFSTTGIKAYKVKVTAKETATMTKVDNVPAGTPVLLYKDGGATESIPVITSAAAVSDNDLVAGTTTTASEGVATTEGDYTNMILNNGSSGIGFYFANGQTVATNRAYLHIASTLAPEATGDAPMMLVFDDGNTTGIDAALVNSERRIENNVYDLQGRKVAQPVRGLYIMNGRKVVIK